jgi:L-2-amino-thiazoline-4-carboxylic acid hydrolase-like protein
MGVLDDFMVNPNISLLVKTRIQAQVLVPVMRAMRAEMGREKADALVRGALREWSKQLFAGIGDGIEGSPGRKFARMNTALAEVTEREVTFEMHRDDREAREFNVTSCRFAEFFRALGEPELGALLICHVDADIADAGGDAVSFSRTQTLMQGAPYCDFRYRFAPR